MLPFKLFSKSMTECTKDPKGIGLVRVKRIKNIKVYQNTRDKIRPENLSKANFKNKV